MLVHIKALECQLRKSSQLEEKQIFLEKIIVFSICETNKTH